MTRVRLLIIALGVLALTVITVHASERQGIDSTQLDVLATAKKLAQEEFAGFRYGSNPNRRQVDCTQFMQAVIEKVIGRSLTDDETQAVLISGLPSGARKLDSLINAEDKRIKGVQYALTEVLPIGRIIEPDSAQPGDMVQYWIKSSTGHYKGHTAIILDVGHDGGLPTARLYGSHKTLGGIGVAVDRGGNDLKLKLKGSGRKVYIVRIEPSRLASVR